MWEVQWEEGAWHLFIGNDCTNDVCNGVGTCTHPNKANGVACGNHAPEGEGDQPDQCLNGQREANRKAGGRTADSGAPSVFFILHPSPQAERARRPRPRQRSARAPARARASPYLPPLEAVRVTGALSTDSLPAAFSAAT